MMNWINQDTRSPHIVFAVTGNDLCFSRMF